MLINTEGKGKKKETKVLPCIQIGFKARFKAIIIKLIPINFQNNNNNNHNKYCLKYSMLLLNNNNNKINKNNLTNKEKFLIIKIKAILVI